jgi:ribosomal protein S25
MNEAKFGNVALEHDVVDVLRQANMPVSVDFIAEKLGVAWGTARAILLSLSVQGVVVMTKTTKSFIFTLKEQPGDATQ